MSVYFVAQIMVKDPDEYQKYLADCDRVFAKYNGQYLAVDDSPVKLEGQWDYGKIVIIRFPSEEALRDWYESEEYQRLLRIRLSAARCDTLIVNGKD